ncbi:hypothetical protein, partial [Amycolatopsis sacchari]|uniref:hypothetical protein n=1 Tax=Amycolatopsis sacchari TaxID=115433 RepID=UPI003EBC24D9
KVAELLAAHADPALPYEVELGEALIVDPPGEVTHLSPVSVRRTGIAQMHDVSDMSSDGHPPWMSE